MYVLLACILDPIRKPMLREKSHTNLFILHTIHAGETFLPKELYIPSPLVSPEGPHSVFLRIPQVKDARRKRNLTNTVGGWEPAEIWNCFYFLSWALLTSKVGNYSTWANHLFLVKLCCSPAIPSHSHNVCGCFHDTMAELSSCDRDILTNKG